MFKHVHLIVGVACDKEILQYKGIGVNNDHERCENVKHCKWVDEIVFPCPWVISEKFLDDTDIDYVAHDDLPYES